MIDTSHTSTTFCEEQKEIENLLKIKIIDLEEGIIEYQEKKWKPVVSMEDIFRIHKENEPVLCIDENYWVDINYLL